MAVKNYRGLSLNKPKHTQQDQVQAGHLDLSYNESLASANPNFTSFMLLIEATNIARQGLSGNITDQQAEAISKFNLDLGNNHITPSFAKQYGLCEQGLETLLDSLAVAFMPLLDCSTPAISAIEVNSPESNPQLIDTLIVTLNELIHSKGLSKCDLQHLLLSAFCYSTINHTQVDNNHASDENSQ